MAPKKRLILDVFFEVTLFVGIIGCTFDLLKVVL